MLNWNWSWQTRQRGRTLAYALANTYSHTQSCVQTHIWTCKYITIWKKRIEHPKSRQRQSTSLRNHRLTHTHRLDIWGCMRSNGILMSQKGIRKCLKSSWRNVLPTTRGRVVGEESVWRPSSYGGGRASGLKIQYINGDLLLLIKTDIWISCVCEAYKKKKCSAFNKA